jgi:hypothetical protein
VPGSRIVIRPKSPYNTGRIKSKYLKQTFFAILTSRCFYLDEFAQLEQRLLADGWIRFSKPETPLAPVRKETILDLLPAGPFLREKSTALEARNIVQVHAPLQLLAVAAAQTDAHSLIE